MIIGSYDGPSGQSHYPMGRVTHICVSKLNTIGSDNGLSPWRRQAITWTKCWDIVNWTRKKKLQGNLNRNSYISIQENEFENVVSEWEIRKRLLNDITIEDMEPTSYYAIQM